MFRVSGFGAWGVGLGVEGLGLDLEFQVFRSRVRGWFEVQGLGFRSRVLLILEHACCGCLSCLSPPKTRHIQQDC